MNRPNDIGTTTLYESTYHAGHYKGQRSTRNTRVNEPYSNKGKATNRQKPKRRK